MEPPDYTSKDTSIALDESEQENIRRGLNCIFKTFTTLHPNIENTFTKLFAQKMFVSSAVNLFEYKSFSFKTVFNPLLVKRCKYICEM